MCAISLEEIGQAANTVKELYDISVKSHYFMPQFKSALISRKYLVEVLRGECFAFSLSDLQQKPLMVPLTGTEIHNCLIAQLTMEAGRQPQVQNRILQLIQHLHKRKGDRAWTLVMLSTLDYQKELPMFKPPPLEQMPAFQANNSADHHLVHLPKHVANAFHQASYSKIQKAQKSSKVALTFLDATQREQLKLHKLRELEVKTQARLVAQQAKIQSMQRGRAPQIAVKMDEDEHA